MKKIFTLISVLFTTFTIANAINCPTYDCHNPIMVSGTVTNMNYGDACLSSAGTTTLTNSVNFNFSNYLTFNGNFIVQQSLNLNNGRVVTVNGNTTFSYVSMGGGSDSSIFYVTDLSNITINTVGAANNTNNFIILGTGATATINGVNYVSGTYYQSGGNVSNRIYIVGCTNGVPLSNNLLSFGIQKNKLVWKVSDESTIDNYTIEYSKDGYLFETYKNVVSEKRMVNTYNLDLSKNGYYRLVINSKDNKSYSQILKFDNMTSSKIIKINNIPFETTSNIYVYDIMGRIVQKVDNDIILSIPKGIYLVRYSIDNQLVTKKVFF